MPLPLKWERTEWCQKSYMVYDFYEHEYDGRIPAEEEGSTQNAFKTLLLSFLWIHSAVLWKKTNAANPTTQEMKTAWIKSKLTPVLLWVIIPWIVTCFFNYISTFFLSTPINSFSALNNLEELFFFFNLHSSVLGIIWPLLKTIFVIPLGIKHFSMLLKLASECL